MQTYPTARHSLLGPFQRVCYLVHAGARIHRSNLGALASGLPTVRRQSRGPRTPGIAELPARARVLEAKLVHLQPGHLAVRPAAGRLVTWARVGVELGQVRLPYRVGILHSWRWCRLGSVVEDLGVRGIGRTTLAACTRSCLVW
jgi:hypothetical protein